MFSPSSRQFLPGSCRCLADNFLTDCTWQGVFIVLCANDFGPGPYTMFQANFPFPDRHPAAHLQDGPGMPPPMKEAPGHMAGDSGHPEQGPPDGRQGGGGVLLWSGLVLVAAASGVSIFFLHKLRQETLHLRKRLESDGSSLIANAQP